MNILNYLDPVYKYLPLCSRIVETEVNGRKVKEVITYKTFPAFPWKMGTGDHRDEDPVEFIKICASQGLVRWETAEQTRLRKERERNIYERGTENR